MGRVTWTVFFANSKLRNQLFISFVTLIVALTGFFFVLAYTDQRSGFVIEKGWMDRICQPKDLSAFIFPLTWPVAFIGVIICARDPKTFLLLIRSYAFLIILRGVTLMSVPLDPPQGIIDLKDPLLHSTFYNGRMNPKDLFFSGHVATILLFVFILKNKFLKSAFLSIAIVLACLLAIQRVHYITDIIFAIPFAWLAYTLAGKWVRNSALQAD